MKWPSMEDAYNEARKRSQRKRDDRSAPEYQAYLTQMAFVREAAKMSGIEAWSHEHTIGALFSCQAIRSGIKMLRDMGMIDQASAQAYVQMVQEQEIVAVQMEEHP